MPSPNKNVLGLICLLLFSFCCAFNSSAVEPITDEGDKIECVQAVYTSQIGVTEELGANDGIAVRGYLKVVNMNQPVAWCAAFVSWAHLQCNIKNPLSAWSPAMFPAKNTIYTRGKTGNQEPRTADVFGLYFPKLKRIAHVGFIDSWPKDSNYVITVEGNTNDAGSREGDGVYRKRRLKQSIYKVSRFTASRA